MDTITAPVEAPALPDLDETLGDQLGDEILIVAAAASKVATVPAGPASGGMTQSHQARAWTGGGSVD